MFNNEEREESKNKKHFMIFLLLVVACLAVKLNSTDEAALVLVFSHW